MKKTLAMLILGTAIFSGSTLANYVTIEVTPQKGGAWVIVEKNNIPVPGMDLVVTNGQKQHYTTSESGRTFVYSPSETARSMTFSASDENGNTTTVQRLIPSSR